MTAVETDNDFSIGQNNDFSTGVSPGGASGNSLMDRVMSMTTIGQIVGLLDRWGQATKEAGGPYGTRSGSVGDGYGNNVAVSGTMEGAGGTGGADGPWQDLIQTIINNSTNNTTTPRTITPNSAAAAEGGRRPASGNGRRMAMPAYRGRFSGRRGGTDYMLPDDPSNGISYTGGSRNFDERTGQYRNTKGGPLINDMGPGGNIINDLAPTVDGRSSMLGPENGLNIAQLFNTMADRATSMRQQPLNSALERMYNRGDIADDASSIGAVTNPMRDSAKGLALSQLLSGSRVSDNLFDLSNLGAKIGQQQGAQNVNVRGRIPQRRRSY